MLRIAIDCRAIGKKRTGDEVYIKNLVINLTKIDRVNQYCLLFDRENPEKDLGFLPPDNFKITVILPASKLFWTMFSLPRWLARNPVDLLHVQYITPLWLPKGIKLITTIHDVSWKFYPEYIKKSDLFFLNTLIPMCLKRADKIITVSKTSKDDITRIFKTLPDKISMIYNGVNSVGYATPDKVIEPERVRKKYGLPENFILYVGTLQPRKNIPSLLEAFKILSTKYRISDVKLVVAGGKGHNYDKRIDTLTEKYKLQDKIVFSGYVDEEDLPIVYKLAKVFVFPSLYEGFGLPVIEAMAAGIPAVVSDKSCLPEIAGEAGIVIDPADSEAFAEAIYSVFRDKEFRHALVEKGRKRAEEFNWEHTARETLTLYEK